MNWKVNKNELAFNVDKTIQHDLINMLLSTTLSQNQIKIFDHYGYIYSDSDKYKTGRIVLKSNFQTAIEFNYSFQAESIIISSLQVWGDIELNYVITFISKLISDFKTGNININKIKQETYKAKLIERFESLFYNHFPNYHKPNLTVVDKKTNELLNEVKLNDWKLYTYEFDNGFNIQQFHNWLLELFRNLSKQNTRIQLAVRFDISRTSKDEQKDIYHFQQHYIHSGFKNSICLKALNNEPGYCINNLIFILYTENFDYLLIDELKKTRTNAS